ncbi:MAG: Zn-ribbon domain-containing OB-fold protein [Dehalococcoidia bacterium]|nr:Zn-ribbon domain-containing OB-fold protein [Dehalococcoidia bacterium]
MPDTELNETSQLVSEKWFIETPHGKALAGSRCPQCGRVYFPRKKVCVQCFQTGQMEDTALSRRGKLYTFTVAEAGPPGFSVPYAFGYVDLPEGIRVFSPLGGDLAALEIGMDVEMSMGRIREENGVDIIGCVFKPV